MSNSEMHRFRRAARCAAVFLLLSGIAGLFLHAQELSYDFLIRGARVVDGTGNPWFLADIGIKNGRIAAIGNLKNATATRVIDAKGLVASPGFIDMHTHSDYSLIWDGNAESAVRQGVTADEVGEGNGAAPRDGLPPFQSSPLDANQLGVLIDWTNFTGYFHKLMQKGISINTFAFAEFSQIRRVVMGYDDHPASPYFSLGRWGLPINAIVVVWGLFVVINIGWPRPEVYGESAWGRFAAVLATCGLVVAGAIYFLLFQRKRTGILSEHAAEDILEERRSVANDNPPIESRWIGQLAPGE